MQFESRIVVIMFCRAASSSAIVFQFIDVVELRMGIYLLACCIAGTRGPMDMVEIPSHFFEHFLQSKDCLSLCCRHNLGGDPMPEELMTSVQRHWRFLPALDMNDTVCPLVLLPPSLS